MYEGGIRPPLVIKAPESNQSTSNNTGSKFVNSFVYVTDFTPTLLDMAGVSHPTTYNGNEVHALMGTSIKPILDGTTDVVHPVTKLFRLKCLTPQLCVWASGKRFIKRVTNQEFGISII